MLKLPQKIEMNSRVVYLFILWMIPVNLFSQEIELSVFEKEINFQSKEYGANTYFAEGRTYFFQKEWDSTIVYTAKQLSLKENSLDLKTFCYFLRGYSFQQKKLYKEAEKEFAKIVEDFTFYNHVQMYLGEIALEEYQFQKALDYLHKVEKLDFNKIIGLNKANLEHNIGLCYLHLEKYADAEYYLLKSTKEQEKEKDTLNLIRSYGNIASMYYEQYKDELAIPYYTKAYVFSKKVNDFDVKRRAVLNMAVVEENRKNYALSLVYRKEFERWKDSLNDQNKIYAVAQLEKQFAIKEKQKQVSLLQTENKLKIAERNGFLYSAIILLVLLGTLFYSYKGKIKRNKIIMSQKEDLDVLNATKDKLFSIVSHDLRSSVNAIKSSNKNLLHNLEAENLEGLKNALQQNSAIVNGAYGLLDNLLNWALLQTKQSYFEMTHLHLSLITEHVAYNYQSLMLDKKISFKNSIAKKTQVFADQESLKIILRNLLDNAIKFTGEGGTIKIYTQDSEEYINLVLEDSGIGMDKTTQQELLKDTQLLSRKKNEDILGTGLGLYLIKSMIQKNQGKFAIESELGKGTKMIVSLLKNPDKNGSH